MRRGIVVGIGDAKRLMGLCVYYGGKAVVPLRPGGWVLPIGRHMIGDAFQAGHKTGFFRAPFTGGVGNLCAFHQVSVI